MPIAYEGSKPYIFVSYSHRDTKLVMRIMDHLQKAGYRVWFDGGIEAGSEWPEYIASHLSKCECFLSFISETFVASQNCRRELNFALDLKKPVLNVYIEEVELTAGMRMQLGLSQAMFRDNFLSDDEFFEALSRAKILENCREACSEIENEASQKPIPEDDPNAKKVTQADDVWDDEVGPDPEEMLHETPEEKKKRRKFGKTICTVSVLLELSYSLVGPKSMEWILSNFSSGWVRFLLMCVPHLLIALIIRMLVVKNAQKLTSDQQTDVFGYSLFAWVAASVLAVIIGTFYVPMEMNGILKFLLSLGLNVVPALIAAIQYFGIMSISAKKSREKRDENKKKDS